MLNFLRRIYEYKKKTMKQSTTQCHNCVNYGFIMVSGGLEKKEFCQKYHKEPYNDCPDWEKWDVACGVITADVKHQKNYRHRFSFDDRDTEEDCIGRIQELIDTIYRVNPNLDYEYRPHIYLKVWLPEEERNK